MFLNSSGQMSNRLSECFRYMTIHEQLLILGHLKMLTLAMLNKILVFLWWKPLERWLNFVTCSQSVGFGYLYIALSALGPSHPLVIELKKSSHYPGACSYPRWFCSERLPPFYGAFFRVLIVSHCAVFAAPLVQFGPCICWFLILIEDYIPNFWYSIK